MQQIIWREEESTLSPSNNGSTSICYFLNSDSKTNQGGEKKMILKFSPYLLIPLDTLISLPPFLPYRMFAWKEMEMAKQKRRSD